MKTPSSYRPDIDGLRALAVLAVLLYHFQFNWIPGGFVGVDVFFVISGFVITRKLRSELAETGRIALGRFTLGRISRLFPALAATIIATLIAGAILLSPIHFERLGTEAMAAIAAVSNIFFWSEAGYFDSDKIFKPLLHTWSLGVEEQFYLVWPAMLMLFARLHRHGLLAVIVLTFVGSLLLAEFFPGETMPFFWTPFRMYEFAMGAGMVWLEGKRVRIAWIEELLLAAGVALIAFAYLTFAESMKFPGTAALVPACGAALVIYAGRAPLLGTLIRNPVSTFVGRISYSLYLVHWPLRILYGYTLLSPLVKLQFSLPQQIGLMAASLVLATALHFLIEQPFRHQKRWPFYGGAAVTAAAVILVGYSVQTSHGWPWRLPPDIAQLVASPRREREPLAECHHADSYFTEAFYNQYAACAAKYPNAVMVLGDSHSGDLFNALTLNSQYPHIAAIRKGGCRPHEIGQEEHCAYNAVAGFLTEHKDGIEALIFTQSGEYFLSDVDGRFTLPVKRDQVDAVIAYLTSLANTGTPIIWVGPHWQPMFPIEESLATMGTQYVAHDYMKDMIWDLEAVDDEIAGAIKAAKAPIQYVSTIDLLGPLTQDEFIIDNEFTYQDIDHWSSKGEEYFGKLLIERSPALSSLLAAKGVQP